MIMTQEEFNSLLEFLQRGEIPNLTPTRLSREPDIVGIVNFDTSSYYINSTQYQAILDTLKALGCETTEQLDYHLPKNNYSKVIDSRTSRFSGAVWYNEVKSKSVILAGIGGIGSFVSFLLSRLDIAQLFIYDDDIVEEANLSGQLYGNTHIGMSKVQAASMIAKSFSKYERVFAINDKYDTTCVGSDIMICGFDNMKARTLFFNSWLKHIVNLSEERKKECLFIDGRLNLEQLQVLCITGNDIYNIRRYKREFLFNDWEAEELACSMKQTTFMANMIGSIITNLFVNFCTYTLPDSQKPIMKRDLPFYTEYNSELMYFKTEN